MSNPPPSGPDKLPAGAIFALLDGAPFGRLATYAPAPGAGRCYVVPLQFLHRDECIYLITTPGRKLANLRAAPGAACFQLDLTEGAGWTSVCAWGEYTDVQDLRTRLSVLSASFSKYPDRTTHQAVSWLRQHRPRVGSGPDAAARALAIGAITIRSVSGRYWPGLLLSVGPDLVRPSRRVPRVVGPRSRPIQLDLAACRAVLESRPLGRVGCYHPARGRMYCLPLWFAVEGNDLWFYHPPGGQVLTAALREHPHGVCVQVDNLDCSPEADPGQPWHSVLAEGHTTVYPLGPEGGLPVDRQHGILRSIRARLQAFAIDSVFVPPDPDLAPPPGTLVRLRLHTISGQATGEPL